MLTHKVIVQLTAATSITSGLTVSSAINVTRYPKGSKVCDSEFAKLNIRYGAFHPDWNYTILLQRTPDAVSK